MQCLSMLDSAWASPKVNYWTEVWVRSSQSAIHLFCLPASWPRLGQGPPIWGQWVIHLTPLMYLNTMCHLLPTNIYGILVDIKSVKLFWFPSEQAGKWTVCFFMGRCHGYEPQYFFFVMLTVTGGHIFLLSMETKSLVISFFLVWGGGGEALELVHYILFHVPSIIISTKKITLFPFSFLLELDPVPILMWSFSCWFYVLMVFFWFNTVHQNYAFRSGTTGQTGLSLSISL